MAEFDNIYYAEHLKKYGEENQDINDISTQITEWIWKKENLSSDENWHNLTFKQVDTKIWELINVS